MITPSLPDTAPFTPEQRGWLNGFLAGLAAAGGSGAPSVPTPAESTPAPQVGVKVSLAWGSQTGNAEGLAKKAGKALAQAGHQVTIHDLAAYPTATLADEDCLLIITSTYGDGEPPDNAADFHEFLFSDEAPALSKTRFAVFALGDSEYPDFCECGKQFDERLGALGGERLVPRIDSDVDYDDPFAEWQEKILQALAPVPA